MGTFAEDRYVATFELEKPLLDVWQVLAAEVGDDPDWMRCWPRMSNTGAAGAVIAVEPQRVIRVHKDLEPCKDTEISISLASTERGTTVTVEQSNLPEWVMLSIDSFVLGGDQIAADLALLLDRGVQTSRHSLPWSFAGLIVREVATGLEVTATVPGTFAAGTGIQPGDLLLTFGGAPVFTQLCLQAMQRVFKPGDEVELTWVRETQPGRGRGVLT